MQKFALILFLYIQIYSLNTMMKLKRFITVLLLVVFVSIGYKYTCSNLSASVSHRMHNQFERVYTRQQFDSICKADTLPNNLNKWRKSQFIDVEAGQYVTEYLFIKSILPSQKIYRVDVIDDEHYKITKRVTR